MKKFSFLKKNNYSKNDFEWRIFKIMAEFIDGFDFISSFEGKKAVTIFGSSRVLPNNKNYKEAEKLGKILAKKGFVVVTGGESGIMEAANKGAFGAEGESVGININLGKKRGVSNSYLHKSICFDHFFVRKVMLSFASSYYVFFPGGYGTLDEFFEIITLVQTKKIDQKVKIILVGKEYWEGLKNWLTKEVFKKQKAIEEKDLDLFVIVDSAQEAAKLIK